MRKNPIGFFRMTHVFLNPEVVHAQIEMKRRGKAYGAEGGSPVRAGEHVMQLGQRSNLAKMTYSSRMNYSHSNVIDQLFAQQLVTIVDRVEDFSDCKRCRCVFPN